jgi:hypothetical protein
LRQRSERSEPVGYRLIVNPNEAFLSGGRNQLAVTGEEMAEIHAAPTG